MPKVSVIMPTYQAVDYVENAIKSILHQTFGDFEVIAVDGGSTDGTLEILDSYSREIRIFGQKSGGVSNARNVGVSAALGEYISFLDSDDLWLPRKLETQVEFLGGAPNSTGLIFSDVCFFGEEASHRTTAFAERKPYRGNALKQIIVENFIPASSVMVRRSCIEKVGVFDERLSLCEDLDMWIRIARFYELDYQEEVLVKIRDHKKSLSKDRQKLLISEIALRKKIEENAPFLVTSLDTRQRSLFYVPYLRLGVFYLLNYEFHKARRMFSRYARLCPTNVAAYLGLAASILPFRENHKASSLSYGQGLRRLHNYSRKALRSCYIVL